MSYSGHLANSQFKHMDDGTWLYFPHGILTKGRRITNEADKDRIFASHKRMINVMLPVALIGGVVLGLVGAPTQGMVALGAILLIIWLNHWRSYRSLARADVRLSFREASGKASKALPFWFGWALLVVSLAQMAMIALLVVVLDKPYAEIADLAFLVIGIGLFGIVVAVAFLWIKKRAREDEVLVKLDGG